MKANSKKMLLINLSIKFGIRHWLKKSSLKNIWQGLSKRLQHIADDEGKRVCIFAYFFHINIVIKPS
jgi:hypothetical protein